jgi:hypothetical protein
MHAVMYRLAIRISRTARGRLPAPVQPVTAPSIGLTGGSGNPSGAMANLRCRASLVDEEAAPMPGEGCCSEGTDDRCSGDALPDPPVAVAAVAEGLAEGAPRVPRRGLRPSPAAARGCIMVVKPVATFSSRNGMAKSRSSRKLQKRQAKSTKRSCAVTKPSQVKSHERCFWR